VFAIGDSAVVVESVGGSDVDFARVFSDGGTERSRVPLPRNWGLGLGLLGDGSMIVASDGFRSPIENGEFWWLRSILRVPPAVWRDSGAVAGVDTLFTIGTRWDSATAGPLRWTHEPLGAIAVDARRIWLAPTDRPEIFAIAPQVSVERRIAWDAGDRALPASVLASWRERQIAALPDSLTSERRARRVAGFEQTRAAATLSAAAKLRVGSDGRVYVRSLEIDEEPVFSRSWLVFEPDGRLAARLTIPEGSTVLAFGAEYVLTRGRSAAGDERLFRYRIVTVSSEEARR
jgi:hypothetical protein